MSRRCREQLDGYGLRVVTNPDETVAFLTALREAALQVGVSEQVRKPDAPVLDVDGVWPT